jgi:ABC-2 type transport system permease protein
MNVYRRELTKGLRSLLFWSLGAIFLIAASAAKYAAMAGDKAAMMLLMSQLPLGLQAMFGVGELDFTTAVGFYGMLYLYLVLIAAIHASMLGATILAKEERDKTAEFIYVKPMARGNILTAKLLAALTLVVLFNLVNWAASAGMVRAFGENADAAVASLMAGMLLVQLIFLAVGIAAAAVSQRPKAAASVATGVMLATYLLSVAIDVNGSIGWLRVLTPFSYFKAGDVIGGAGLSVPYALLSLGLIAGLVGWAYARFSRRDLKI